MTAVSDSKSRLSTSLALSTVPLLLLFYTLLNGYILNLVSDYQANPWLVLAGVALETVLTLAAARRLISIQFDGVEAAAFALVVLGVWIYFIAASWPTLLPPTQSVDAVRHYLQALFSYPEGTLVSWYPAGGAFIVAMFSNWLFVTPLQMLHPVAALFIALSAGVAYGITCDIVPPTRLSKLTALVAPALLFVPWSYFAGSINWEQYFFAQVAAQYFVVAALWLTVAYASHPKGLYIALLGAALLGIAATYPYLVVLPIGVFILVLAARVVVGKRSPESVRGALAVIAALVALLALFAIALQYGGILELGTFQIATQGDVGEGGVTNPSLETLGGPILLLLALLGMVRAWKTGARGRTLLAFMVIWLLQLVALVLVQPYIQVSGYRVDKTFYILVYPFAISAALVLAWLAARFKTLSGLADRRTPIALSAVIVILAVGIITWRPPVLFTPLSASELAAALWAKEHLKTNLVNGLAMDTTKAYWIAVGLWQETLPNEYFQWIPAGPKLGPNRFDEWINDSAWGDYLLVGDTTRLSGPLPTAIYQNGPTSILAKGTTVSAAPIPKDPVTWQYEDYIRLIGYDLARTTYRPGETIALTTYEATLNPPPATVSWRVELIDAAGNAVSKAAADVFGGKYPLQRWSPGHYFRDQWSLALDPSLAPGLYHLQMGLYRRTDGAAVRLYPPPGYDPAKEYYAASLTDIKVPVAPPSPSELSAAMPLGATFGDEFKLSSYTLNTDRATRTVRLMLYWTGLKTTKIDYTIFVHLLDQNGTVVVQQDAGPRDGTYPTSIWDSGEVVPTEYTFSIPADKSWPTNVEIGMYTLPDLQRLPTGASDRVLLPIAP